MKQRLYNLKWLYFVSKGKDSLRFGYEDNLLYTRRLSSGKWTAAIDKGITEPVTRQFALELEKAFTYWKQYTPETELKAAGIKPA